MVLAVSHFLASARPAPRASGFEGLEELERDFQVVLQQIASIARGGRVGQSAREAAIDRLRSELDALERLDGEINRAERS